MKKAILLTLLSLATAWSAFADGDRHQSYISYDDGGTVIRQADDGREVEARKNMPVYPDDELITSRRGRAEVRLSDGNIVGIDSATALKFRSILDSYEGDSDETVAELRYGKVALYRTDLGRDHVRLDTQNASYVAENEAVYSIETDARGHDRVTVFDGSVEVRTPQRTTRMRSGESATVDDRGVYDLAGDQRDAADDFERWFLRRVDRFENYNNRYVDRRLGYWADDLDDYGSWVFVTGIGYSWRPRVAAGWRPYYQGYWHYSRHGCLTWVSYDPWGWGPYHYGRWSFDPFYGWVWVPGYGYSPAWVYWWYGPSYIGWAPAGWWDCHRGYYDWAYRPYRNREWGAGFYGRVRIHEMDLRPWTFVDSNTIISTRIDRAALTTDAIKQRLGRSKDGFATIGGGSQRFTRDEIRDPAEVIHRRGLDGSVTGRETGSGAVSDLTPFFRRDAQVSGAVRDRIVRSRGGSPSPSGGTTIPSRNMGSGTLTPSGGSAGRIDRSGDSGSANTGSGRDTAWRGRTGERGGTGTIDRGADRSGTVDRRGDRGTTDRGTTDRGSAGRGEGGRIDRGGDRPVVTPPPPSTSTTPPPDTTERPRNESWRNRVRSDDNPPPPSRSGSGSSTSSGSSDVPRRVIDRIGGARIYPRGSEGGGSRDRGTVRGGDSGSRDRGTVRGGDSGGSRGSSGGSSPRSGDGGGSSNRSSGGGNRDSGGHIKRDH